MVNTKEHVTRATLVLIWPRASSSHLHIIDRVVSILHRRSNNPCDVINKCDVGSLGQYQHHAHWYPYCSTLRVGCRFYPIIRGCHRRGSRWTDSVKNGQLTSIACQSTHSTWAIPHHCLLYATAQGEKQFLDHYQHMFDQLESIPTNSYIHTVCT